MCREVVNIQSRYYLFGIELGLPLREMEVIKKELQLDIPQAFTAVLTRWLRQSYDVKKYGPPIWRRLVEAVDIPAGGNDHALAKRIADHHPVKEVNTVDQHPSATEEIPASESITEGLVDSSTGGDSQMLKTEIGEQQLLSAPEESLDFESTHAVTETVTKHQHKGR